MEWVDASRFQCAHQGAYPPGAGALPVKEIHRRLCMSYPHYYAAAPVTRDE